MLAKKRGYLNWEPLMDDKLKINYSGNLSFGTALVINFLLIITFIGTRIYGNNWREIEFLLVIILAPVAFISIISGIIGIILAVSKKTGGFIFSLLGIIGSITPLARIWCYLGEISSIQG